MLSLFVKTILGLKEIINSMKLLDHHKNDWFQLFYSYTKSVFQRKFLIPFKLQNRILSGIEYIVVFH
jgi:hypothetical protein